MFVSLFCAHFEIQSEVKRFISRFIQWEGMQKQIFFSEKECEKTIFFSEKKCEKSSENRIFSVDKFYNFQFPVQKTDWYDSAWNLKKIYLFYEMSMFSIPNEYNTKHILIKLLVVSIVV